MKKLFFAILIGIKGVAFAQKSDFSGNYKVNEQKVNWGPAPKFILPRYIKVEQQRNRIIITRVGLNESLVLQAPLSDTISFDGSVSKKTTANGSILSSTLRWLTDKTFEINKETIDASGRVTGKVNENWTIEDSGQTLMINRNVDSRTKYTTKAYFYRIKTDVVANFFENNNQKLQRSKQTELLYPILTAALFNDSLRKDPKELIPDWKKLEKSYIKKYGDTVAARSVLTAKQSFYSAKVNQDWNKIAEAWLEDTERFKYVEKMEDRMSLLVGINGFLYRSIFKNTTDNKLLLRAAVIAKKVIDNPNSYKNGLSQQQKDSQKANLIDTYANLLYKAGKQSEAVEWQSKSVEITNSKIEEFLSNLSKMKEGKPTW
ncbi:hypothetical protein FFJ24_021425 [Pedobacter sp. KBS0701]|uniref:hypothetical protein n=1 Tax=Pedobacter sp. KBS0701 TaxID=2578106 RepID=UPI00110DBB4C|nr:hypothetical protein [Pedobacter sp. KBS0701]QDW27249.1 hypothetical protein FFJ24_021425 [Pedobacter sp. KBS0701]